MNREDLHRLRKEYLSRELHRIDMDEDPSKMFFRWLKEGIAAMGEDANAMALSTSSRDGHPSSRMVLLKELDHHDFIFYSNYNSRKGQQLADNPRASLLFWWPTLERQVRIEGFVSKVTDEKSNEYFSSRPAGSQIGAVASPQSQELVDRTELDLRVQSVMEEFNHHGTLARPEYWGGYKLSAHYYEFWQGRASRLHDRFVYARVEDSHRFELKRIAP